jgi:flavin reductase (DIM6/NTAB) family NADH-FMN oxidoreductase RutF
MDQRKLRDCLGLFATGVIIACARRKNFFSEGYFAEKIGEKFFEEKIKKFEDSWHNFLKENELGRRLEKKFPTQNFLEKIKKIFADEFFGMTINSFTSISLNPPLVSFSIDNRSSNLALFKKNRYFSLNILSQEQQKLSGAFATPKNSSKWGVEPYFFAKKGSPIFQNSLAFFECKKHKIIKLGDHHMVIGEVIDFGKVSDAKPLLYYSGKYSEVSK